MRLSYQTFRLYAGLTRFTQQSLHHQMRPKHCRLSAVGQNKEDYRPGSFNHEAYRNLTESEAVSVQCSAHQIRHGGARLQVLGPRSVGQSPSQPALFSEFLQTMLSD